VFGKRILLTFARTIGSSKWSRRFMTVNVCITGLAAFSDNVIESIEEGNRTHSSQICVLNKIEDVFPHALGTNYRIFNISSF
jgi:hypothetical protein